MAFLKAVRNVTDTLLRIRPYRDGPLAVLTLFIALARSEGY